MLAPEVLLLVAGVAVGAFALAGVLATRGRVATVESYVTARNSMGLPAATATFIASVMGSWILFSPAEAGVLWGLPAILGYGVGSAVPLLVFYFLGPRVRRLVPHGHGVTEYALVRFGRGMYGLVLLATVFYMFIFLTAELTAIALTFHLLGGIPLLVSALLVGVATLAYTAYGGLRASVFTDSVQTLLLLPLMVVGFLGALLTLGGPGVVYAQVEGVAPELLRLDHVPGLHFAVFVTIAIAGANMFNQGYWQRFFAAQDETVLRRGLAVAAFAVVPMVVLAGLFGLAAVGLGVVDVPSVALFSLILVALPDWLVLVLFLLVLALIMSTLDTLLNGIASILASDLPHVGRGWRGKRLLRATRLLTVLLAGAAIAIASFGFSVLFLFLLADLVCAACAFPALYGLHSERLDGGGALVASLAGIAVGAPLFALGLLAADLAAVASLFLLSFGLALGVSVLLSLLLARGETRYDLDRLSVEIAEIGE